MPILNIAPATRQGMRFIICLYGMSETGKTLSALKLAAGMEPDPARRGLLDTEGGQRGRAYVDHVDGGYLYGQLTGPFTPERYIEGIAEFEAAGCNVLVIDSGSHAWFGEGGILDMVDNATDRNDMAKWKAPKRRLSKMAQRIMHSDMHVILCLRGKQPLVDAQGPNGKTIKVPGPVVPIMEKALWFDLSIVAQMLGDGKFDIARPAGKCPGPLREVFAAGSVMTEDMGRRLINWLGRPAGKSPEQRALEQAATEAAEGGTDAFRAYWSGLTGDQRAMLKPRIANYQSIAAAADREAEERAREAREAALVNSDPFGPGPGQPITVAPTAPPPPPPPPTFLTLHLPDGPHDFATLDEAFAAYAGAIAGARYVRDKEAVYRPNADLVAAMIAAGHDAWRSV